jgi:hypothetical protein
MKLVTDVKEWAIAVASLPGKPLIATYNLALFQKHGPVSQILESIDQKGGSILVGVPAFKSCTDYPDRCRACLNKHKKSLLRMAQLREHYKNIVWSYVMDSHAKFAVGEKTVVLGGRNLSDSRYKDISVVLENEQLAAELVAEWSGINYAAYDIGTDGPLVFYGPYKGEIMADSSSIKEEFKAAIVKDRPQSDLAEYWMKHK